MTARSWATRPPAPGSARAFVRALQFTEARLGPRDRDLRVSVQGHLDVGGAVVYGAGTATVLLPPAAPGSAEFDDVAAHEALHLVWHAVGAGDVAPRASVLEEGLAVCMANAYLLARHGVTFTKPGFYQTAAQLVSPLLGGPGQVDWSRVRALRAGAAASRGGLPEALAQLAPELNAGRRALLLRAAPDFLDPSPWRAVFNLRRDVPAALVHAARRQLAELGGRPRGTGWLVSAELDLAGRQAMRQHPAVWAYFPDWPGDGPWP